MSNAVWPILLVIGANTFYHISAKSTPSNANSFFSLSITYLFAAILSFFMFFSTSQTKNIASEFGKLNWTAVAFGFAIIGLEYGYINLYRAGWKVSVGSLVANLGLACMLQVVGLLLYRETISIRQLIGILVCGVGMFLISK